MTCHLFRSKAKRRSSGRLSLDKSPMEQVTNNVENFQIGQRCEVPWCLLRAILILNGVTEFGGRIWAGSFEGSDIFRFCCYLYAALPRKSLDVLRGGPMKKGHFPKYEGAYDLRRVCLPNIVGSREIRSTQQ
jgi:hypothetical protein